MEWQITQPVMQKAKRHQHPRVTVESKHDFQPHIYRLTTGPESLAYPEAELRGARLSQEFWQQGGPGWATRLPRERGDKWDLKRVMGGHWEICRPLRAAVGFLLSSLLRGRNALAFSNHSCTIAKSAPPTPLLHLSTIRLKSYRNHHLTFF